MPAPNMPALNMLLFHIKNQIDPIYQSFSNVIFRNLEKSLEFITYAFFDLFCVQIRFDTQH